MPLFSVVIPTFNREAYVAATLDSLLAQECDDWELIVVDDGSTDATLDVVRGYCDRLPGRSRILEQDHRGCAAARNRGAEAAEGEYLAFLDSDDLWFPWTLRVLAEQIERHGRPAMIAITLHNFQDEADALTVTETQARAEAGTDFLTDAMRMGFALGVAHTVCRREAYQRAGGCLERDINGTDSDVLLKMGVEPGFVRVHEPPLLAYRQHDGAVTTNPQKGYDGMLSLLQSERAGVYPGGPGRRHQRLAQILIRVRAVSVRCVNAGRADLGWSLYGRAFWWNLTSGRLRYLLAFPLLPLRVRLFGKWKGFANTKH